MGSFTSQAVRQLQEQTVHRAVAGDGDGCWAAGDGDAAGAAGDGELPVCEPEPEPELDPGSTGVEGTGSGLTATALEAAGAGEGGGVRLKAVASGEAVLDVEGSDQVTALATLSEKSNAMRVLSVFDCERATSTTS
jgi:hypothetical protein